MQNNRRNVGILIIIIGLILIALIIYFGFLRKSAPVEPEGTATTTPTVTSQLPTGPEVSTTTPSDKPRNYQKYDISQEAPRPTGSADLAKRAMLYSERLGSYSSQSDYSNFTDLKIYMTDSLRVWSDKYVAELKSQVKNNAYYGIETKALTTEVKSFNDKSGTADIVVTTERRESTEKIGGGEPFIQKIDLSFVKTASGDWLMDKAYWEK
jgi:hypothetical protein